MLNPKAYNRGKADGINSKKMNNPIHNNWPKGKHFNKDYERGYWDGYSSK